MSVTVVIGDEPMAGLDVLAEMWESRPDKTRDLNGVKLVKEDEMEPATQPKDEPETYDVECDYCEKRFEYTEYLDAPPPTPHLCGLCYERFAVAGTLTRADIETKAVLRRFEAAVVKLETRFVKMADSLEAAMKIHERYRQIPDRVLVAARTALNAADAPTPLKGPIDGN